MTAGIVIAFGAVGAVLALGPIFVSSTLHAKAAGWGVVVVAFGIGMAATVRVGHAVGRNDAPAVRRAGLVATLLGIVFMSVMTLAVILGRYAIGRFFFGEAADSAGAVIELTAALLLVGATFFVADGIQTVVAGALRGLNDTRVPLLFAAISYWLIGFPTAAALGFRTPLGAAGVWIGLSCGTAVHATLLVLRFRMLTARLSRPDDTAAARVQEARPLTRRTTLLQ